MTLIWFVRHGESVSNANLPTLHPALSPLTPRGWQEARQIATAFNQPPSLIVTSSYARARETAVPTMQRFPHVRQEIWPVHEFTYLHPQRYFQTRGSDRGEWSQAYWQRNDPFEQEGGEGESFEALLVRAQEMLAYCHQRQEEWIVVFSHGMWIRCLIWQLLTQTRIPSAEAMRRYGRFLQAVHIPNGAIWPILFTPDAPPQFGGFRTSHITLAAPDV